MKKIFTAIVMLISTHSVHAQFHIEVAPLSASARNVISYAPAVGISHSWEFVHTQVLYQWNVNYSHTGYAFVGPRMYGERDVRHVILLGGAYSTFSSQAVKTGEKLPEGWSLALGYRAEFEKVALQVDVTKAHATVRFQFTLLNNK